MKTAVNGPKKNKPSQESLEHGIARGVGQYVGLMYSVEVLNNTIRFLEVERDKILAILTKPLAVPDKKERKE